MFVNSSLLASTFNMAYAMWPLAVVHRVNRMETVQVDKRVLLGPLLLFVQEARHVLIILLVRLRWGWAKDRFLLEARRRRKLLGWRGRMYYRRVLRGSEGCSWGI
jgi:hypothetical protein